MSKTTCLDVKNTSFSYAKAYFYISLRFFTTYFSIGGPLSPLKTAYAHHWFDNKVWHLISIHG